MTINLKQIQQHKRATETATVQKNMEKHTVRRNFFKLAGILTGIAFGCMPLMGQEAVSERVEFHQLTDWLSGILSETTIAWVVVALSAVLFVLRKIRGDYARSGGIYIVSNTIFLAVCLLEVLHAVIADNKTWFCTPDRVGWLWTIINFVLLGFISYNQIFYLLDVLGDLLYNTFDMVTCDFRPGLYSWPIAVLLVVLCAIVYRPGINFVLIALAVVQLVQIVLIFRSYRGNVKGSMFCSLVYLIGSFGTVVTVATFASILIIVAAILTALWIVLKLTASSSGNSYESSASGSGTSDNSNSGNSTSGSSASGNSPNRFSYCKNCPFYPGYSNYCTRGDRHVRGSETAGDCTSYGGGGY
jgi:hypothetical protein